MLHLYKRISTSDVGRFEQMVALNEASLVIGSAPGEWVTEPHQLRGGFEIEGVRLEPGGHPQGWGWFTDEPRAGPYLARPRGPSTPAPR